MPSSLRYSRWSHDSAPNSRGERGAALVAELLGVQLDRQAERARGLEHAPRLRRREADALAEGVDRIDQALGVQLRQPGADGVDVVVGAAVELGRQRVRGQAGGAHVERQLAAERGAPRAGSAPRVRLRP